MFDSGQVINRVSNFWSGNKQGRENRRFGHKQGKGFGKRAAQPYPIFLGVPSGGQQCHETKVGRLRKAMDRKTSSENIASHQPRPQGAFPWLSKARGKCLSSPCPWGPDRLVLKVKPNWFALKVRKVALFTSVALPMTFRPTSDEKIKTTPKKLTCLY